MLTAHQENMTAEPEFQHLLVSLNMKVVFLAFIADRNIFLPVMPTPLFFLEFVLKYFLKAYLNILFDTTI